MKKTLLIFIMLSLTITSFSEKKENVKSQRPNIGFSYSF